MDEKRASVRWKVALPVRYLGLNKHSESAARTQDLSISGARLSMVEKHRIGDKLEMMLEVPQESNRPLCIEANVVWQREDSNLEDECNYMTGVVFRKINDCCKSSLLEYVSANHPQEFRQHWWDGVK
jgi:hypothetical protein